MRVSINACVHAYMHTYTYTCMQPHIYHTPTLPAIQPFTPTHMHASIKPVVRIHMSSRIHNIAQRTCELKTVCNNGFHDHLCMQLYVYWRVHVRAHACLRAYLIMSAHDHKHVPAHNNTRLHTYACMSTLGYISLSCNAGICQIHLNTCTCMVALMHECVTMHS